MKISEPSLHCRGLLAVWWASMPDWAKHAYYNCAVVHRVINECAMRETTREEMQRAVAGALYEQRNQWIQRAIYLQAQMPAVEAK